MGIYPNGQANRSPNAAGLLGWVNLLDEGGSGSGGPDDSIPLNALVTAMAAVIGGTIVMPPGTYRLVSNVTIPSTVGLIIASGVTLTGAGALATSGTGVITDWRAGLNVIGAFSVGLASPFGGGQSAAAAPTASSGTIAVADRISRVSPAAAVTAVILSPGTAAGQIVTVVNEAIAANSVTFAVAGTSNVADGVSSVIAGLTARTFVWDSQTSLWYPSK